MFKKFSKAAAASLFVFTALSADQMDSGKGMPEMYDGGWYVGPSFNNSNITSGSYWTANVGYFDDWFLVDLGVAYEHVKFNSHNRKRTGHSTANIVPVLAHLGLRERIYQNLFVTYGAFGTVFCGETGEDDRPYAVGAFVGLDYQISRHFLLSGKVNAFSYDRLGDDTKNWSLFNTGTLAVSYVF